MAFGSKKSIYLLTGRLQPCTAQEEKKEEKNERFEFPRPGSISTG